MRKTLAERRHDPSVRPRSLEAEQSADAPLSTAADVPGHRFASLQVNLPTSLDISEPGDALEQEAERVAARVVDPQELELQDEGEAKRVAETTRRVHGAPTTVARAADGGPPAASGASGEALGDAIESSGVALDSATRKFMEPRFGHDFSRVRIHADAGSGEAAASIQARAFTFGTDIVFGAGEYEPGTSGGQRLLAHELTHVVQQSTGSARDGRISRAPSGLVQRQPQATAGAAPAPDLSLAPGPAGQPGQSALGTVVKALLTPSKPQRQGDAILFRGNRFTADAAQVGQELIDVYEHTAYGARSHEDSLDIFVDDAIAQLNNPASIEDARAASLQSTGPATPQLCKDVIAALETGRKYVHTVHSQFLVDFQNRAVKVFDSTLDKSRDSIEKERDRYGVQVDQTKIFGIVLRQKTTMASNNDSTEMLKALNELHAKYGKWAMAKGLNSSGFSIYGADAEAKATEFAIEYNTARAAAETKFPIISAFNLDLSRGAELDGEFKRVAESPAAAIGPQIAEKLDNISTTRTAVWEKLSRVWGFPGIVSLAKSEMALAPKSHMDIAVNDRVTELQEDYGKKQLALGAITLALTALAPFTGGTTAVLATAIGAAMTVDSIQEAMIQQAAAGTDFQKAQAISKEEPNWYWVAAEVVATLVDVKGALTEFRALLGLKREAMAAKLAAEASKDTAKFEEAVGRVKERGNARRPGLGDKIEQEVRVKKPTTDDLPPESAPNTVKDPNVLGAKPDYALLFKDEARAHAVYNDWIKVRPEQEVALAYCPKTQEWTVIHGSADEVKFPKDMFTDQAGTPWTIMKHYHPGGDAIMRVPSIEDFKALAGRHPDSAWESIVEYTHPNTGKKRYTYYGYDPADTAQPYWVKYMTPSDSGPGTVATKRFAHAPHSPQGKLDYTNFITDVETKNREAMQGAATRP